MLLGEDGAPFFDPFRPVAHHITSKVWVNNHIHVLKPNSNVDARFLTYTLNVVDYIEYIEGSVLTKLTQGNMNQINIPCPLFHEQQAIADYLDKKCAELDCEIASKQKQIELLEELKQTIITDAVTRGINATNQLKDSKNVIIGLIPQDWQTKRLKYICHLNGRIGFRGYNESDIVEEGEGAITLSPSNLKGLYMNYSDCKYLSWYKYYESPEIQVFPDDILFVKTGSTRGRSAFVQTIPMECTINPQLLVLHDFKNAHAKYYAYVMKTHLCWDQVEMSVVGGTIPTIAQEKIENYRFPYPPLEEQEEIVRYLDIQTAKIDSQIAAQQKQIELINELKQSIVSQAVTGKIKI